MANRRANIEGRSEANILCSVMTEQELNEKVDTLERRENLTFFDYRDVIDWVADRTIAISFGIIVLFLMMILAWGPLAFFSCLAVAVYGLIDYTLRRDAENALPFWERFFTFYTAAVGELPASSQNFANRIAQLYDLNEARHLLPYRLAARLLDTHHKQNTSLLHVNARLKDIDKLYLPLKQNLEQLKELQATNELGARRLKELEEDRQEILSLKERIEVSSRNLEVILYAVENEARKRVLQAEVTRLASAAPKANANEPNEGVMSDSAYTLEQQITSEVTHYLQMEREIEQRLG